MSTSGGHYYPWAGSPQLVSAVGKVALRPPLAILRLLELLTEHLGQLVKENSKDILRSSPFCTWDWILTECPTHVDHAQMCTSLHMGNLTRRYSRLFKNVKSKSSPSGLSYFLQMTVFTRPGAAGAPAAPRL